MDDKKTGTAKGDRARKRFRESNIAIAICITKALFWLTLSFT